MKLEETFYFLKALGFEALSWTQAGAEAIDGHQNMTTVPVWSWSLWHILPSHQNKVTYRTKPAPIKQTYSCLQLHLQQISSTLTYFVSPIVYPTSLKTNDMKQCEKCPHCLCVGFVQSRRGGDWVRQASSLIPLLPGVGTQEKGRRTGWEQGRSFCSQVILDIPPHQVFSLYISSEND